VPNLLVDSERIYHQSRRADREAPHLLLLHGAGGSHQLWALVANAIPGHSIHMLDLPGHGRSDGPPRWTVSDYAGVCIGFLDALGIEQVAVAGHSMGGAIAIMMALTWPARVSGLILAGTGARLRVRPDLLDDATTDPRRVIRLMSELAYGHATAPEIIRRAEQQMLKDGERALAADLAACESFDVTSRIRAPTLVLCGTRDRLTPPKYAEFLAQRIVGARLQWIADAGHMLMVERPGPTALAIHDFLGPARV